MRRMIVILMLPALLGQAPAPKEETAAEPLAKAKRERLLTIYRQEAAGYTIYRDAQKTEKVELQPEPVYVWTNQVRARGQDGAVFVWTCRGRAEVVGCFFSFPAIGERKLHHELHSLATTILDVTRPGEHTWTPEAPGIELKPVPRGPAPAASPAGRLVQMRAMIRDFSANTKDFQGRGWELRPLPKPLYRDESTDPDVLDGAVFAFVTSAGTDPEVLIVLEARRPAGGGSPSWQYAVARFTDLDHWVRYKGTEVYKGERIPWDQAIQDPKHRYRHFRDRLIPPVEDPSP